jgi:hypothetical protein
VLAANGLTINLSKCTFMVPELEVLGHIINKSGTTPTPKHIQVIIGYPPPHDTKQLQRYLGMVNFYRRFTPGIAAVLKLLTVAFKGRNKTQEWTPALDITFQCSKQLLAAAVPLAYPAPTKRAYYSPLHSTSPARDTSVQSDLSRTSFTPVVTVTGLYICIARIKSVYSCSLY